MRQLGLQVDLGYSDAIGLPTDPRIGADPGFST
jgi:hypothetical protein